MALIRYSTPFRAISRPVNRILETSFRGSGVGRPLTVEPYGMIRAWHPLSERISFAVCSLLHTTISEDWSAHRSTGRTQALRRASANSAP